MSWQFHFLFAKLSKEIEFPKTTKFNLVTKVGHNKTQRRKYAENKKKLRQTLKSVIEDERWK